MPTRIGAPRRRVHSPEDPFGPTKVDPAIDFGRCAAALGDPTLVVMLPEVLVPAEPDAVHAKRSRRDWIVDTTFFVVALLFGAIVVGSVAEADKP